MRAGDLPERTKNKDTVQGAKDHRIDQCIHVEETAIGGHRKNHNICKYNNRKHPTSKIPPFNEDLFTHEVSDGGEED